MWTFPRDERVKLAPSLFWRVMEGFTTGAMLFSAGWLQWQSDVWSPTLLCVYAVHWSQSFVYHVFPSPETLLQDYLWINVLSAERLRAMAPVEGAVAHVVLMVGGRNLVEMERARVLAIFIIVSLMLTHFQSAPHQFASAVLWALVFACWRLSTLLDGRRPWNSMFTILYHLLLGVLSTIETTEWIAQDPPQPIEMIGPTTSTTALTVHVVACVRCTLTMRRQALPDPIQ